MRAFACGEAHAASWASYCAKREMGTTCLQGISRRAVSRHRSSARPARARARTYTKCMCVRACTHVCVHVHACMRERMNDCVRARTNADTRARACVHVRRAPHERVCAVCVAAQCLGARQPHPWHIHMHVRACAPHCRPNVNENEPSVSRLEIVPSCARVCVRACVCACVHA